jgi:hypothetical protein
VIDVRVRVGPCELCQRSKLIWKDVTIVAAVAISSRGAQAVRVRFGATGAELSRLAMAKNWCGGLSRADHES